MQCLLVPLIGVLSLGACSLARRPRFYSFYFFYSFQYRTPFFLREIHIIFRSVQTNT